MDGEMILVAVDASKEITDYALEWAVCNVIKAMDSLVLLAVIPSHGCPPAGGNRTHQSRLHQFLSCLQKKWGLKQNEESSSDQTGLVNEAEQNVSLRINNICVQMMQQLCAAHNVMKVHTEVNVLADAHMGSVATKAGQLGATWVILDRGLKKEGDCCLKQLNCNIILIDHAIPKVLKAVNQPTVKKLNMGGLQSDPTVADMLGVLPTCNPDYNSITTRSSLELDSRISDTDVSFSLSSIDNDQPSLGRFKPRDTFLHLDSQFFHQEVEAQATFSSTPPYSKSQSLNKASRFDNDESPRKSSASLVKEKTKFSIDESALPTFSSTPPYSKSQQLNKASRFSIDESPRESSASPMKETTKFSIDESALPTFSSTPPYSKSQPLNKASRFGIDESPRKSSASPMKEKTKSYSGLLKTKSEMNNCNSVKATQTAPIPSRRSIDSLRLCRKPGSLNQSTHLIIKRDSMNSYRSEAIATSSSRTIERTSSIRRAMSLSIKQPPTPPPLCSVCKHNAPIFGKVPRKFSYKEIERATDRFSDENFLAEGGYGSVYRGVLPDGQVVAVKQHKMLSAQGASEFYSEVEVLSCAQHRNLVMLVGYCIEMEWLLVYEFACNGSLDKHLYGTETNEVMAWKSRMKVAIGAARGLRYLHEDCRLGCIVHRDFRPTNILLTHDFEPMVGDFGLARWQSDGQLAEETRVIGAFGYLAPEYIQTGLITERADVYAFGVVLLELLSGFKATDFSINGLQQYLPEWGRPLLERKICSEIIDPRLGGNYKEKEVECMMHAASLCITPHPELRPRMSKVLRILEGDMPDDMAYHYGQSTSSYPTQEVKNGYATERKLNETLNYSPSHLTQSMYHLNMSPSSSNAYTNNNQNSIFKPMTPSDEHKMVRGDWGLNKSEMLVSEEYQAYLQGSLAKFIHNLKG